MEAAQAVFSERPQSHAIVQQHLSRVGDDDLATVCE
jgi:hypothetical protein